MKHLICCPSNRQQLALAQRARPRSAIAGRHATAPSTSPSLRSTGRRRRPLDCPKMSMIASKDIGGSASAEMGGRGDRRSYAAPRTHRRSRGRRSFRFDPPSHFRRCCLCPRDRHLATDALSQHPIRDDSDQQTGFESPMSSRTSSLCWFDRLGYPSSKVDHLLLLLS